MKRDELKDISQHGLQTMQLSIMTLILGAYDAGYSQGKTDQKEEDGETPGE